jgi:hypothetical protein
MIGESGSHVRVSIQRFMEIRNFIIQQLTSVDTAAAWVAQKHQRGPDGLSVLGKLQLLLVVQSLGFKSPIHVQHGLHIFNID